jgi:hypothetical protein
MFANGGLPALIGQAITVLAISALTGAAFLLAFDYATRNLIV